MCIRDSLHAELRHPYLVDQIPVKAVPPDDHLRQSRYDDAINTDFGARNRHNLYGIPHRHHAVRQHDYDAEQSHHHRLSPSSPRASRASTRRRARPRNVNYLPGEVTRSTSPSSTRAPPSLTPACKPTDDVNTCITRHHTLANIIGILSSAAVLHLSLHLLYLLGFAYMSPLLAGDGKWTSSSSSTYQAVSSAPH